MTIVSGNENGAEGQTIVVIGGRMHIVSFTNSVIVWDPSTKRWRNGPSLNDRRRDLVVVVCHDKVYAIGGDNNYDNDSTLDTIESIQVSSLLETMETLMTTRQNNNQWTRLQCCLSSPCRQCAAVVVHNCYVVILGGVNGMHHNLSSVDIMDTAPPHNNNNSNGEPMIVAGPSMNSRVLLELYLSDSFLYDVVKHTNEYGHYRAPQTFKNVTIGEIYIFFSIILHMGVVHLPSKEDYWRGGTIWPLHTPC